MNSEQFSINSVNILKELNKNNDQFISNIFFYKNKIKFLYIVIFVLVLIVVSLTFFLLYHFWFSHGFLHKNEIL